MQRFDENRTDSLSLSTKFLKYSSTRAENRLYSLFAKPVVRGRVLQIVNLPEVADPGGLILKLSDKVTLTMGFAAAKMFGRS